MHSPLRALALITVTLTLLSACGNGDKNDGAKSAKAAATTPPPSPPGPGEPAKCENPVPYDQVSSRWLRVNPNKFIDGTEGTWELVKTQIHAVHTDNEKTKTATAIAQILERGAITPDILVKNTCLDIAEGENFSLSAEPHFSIARANGSFQDRLAMRFTFLSEDSEETAEVTSLAAVETFTGLDAEPQVKQKGGTTKFRLYKISATEFELRLHLTMPGENGGQLVVSQASRYKLKAAN